MSKSTLPEPRGDAGARARFAAWLEQHPAADAAALEELCATEPDDADWFRRWWRQLAAIGEVGGEALPQRTTTADIGPYRLCEELGRGGQAVVHLAEDTRTGEQVALKVLPAHAVSSADRLERFRREAEMLRKLAHPGLCAVREAGEADGVIYLAMAYAPGRTLAAIIEEHRSHPRPWRETATVIEQTARALHVAHEQGLIHRDIKPSNLIVTPDGQPVVLDFGLAREEEDLTGLTLSGDLLGTPAYMSPEQLTAHRIRLDRRTDVYSLGATLYEALTGQRPFAAPTVDRLFQAILTHEPKPVDRFVPGLPRDLGVVVQTCMDKDRERRYATALDLAEDLRRVIERRRVLARRVGRIARTVRWARRHPLASSVVAAQLLALVVVLYNYLRAESALAEVNVLATGPQLQRALDAERPLMPPWPELLPHLHGWLTDHAEPLRKKRAALQAVLDLDGERALSADTEAELTRWTRNMLVQFDAFFVDRVDGTFGVRARIAWAERLQQLEAAHADAWAAARVAIRAHPGYGRLDLAPQAGLVPLGANPHTGLWEFMHLASAPDPARVPGRGTDGYVGPEHGIVFVLLPPAENIEAQLLAAYELTQAQWKRLARDRDGGSHFKPGPTYGEGELRVTELHPMEWHSYEEVTWVLARWGLALPSDAVWRYAAGGAEQEPLDAYAVCGTKQVHRRVGSKRANAFGLFDTLGNVLEMVGTPRDGEIALRGGSFGSPLSTVTPTAVALAYTNARSKDVGVRVARPIVRG